MYGRAVGQEIIGFVEDYLLYNLQYMDWTKFLAERAGNFNICMVVFLRFTSYNKLTKRLNKK